MQKFDFGFTELKNKQREIRGDFPRNFGLRIHRMISWIGRAEVAAEDPDAAFIFLWIAFNAAYADARDLENASSCGEHGRFSEFFDKIIEDDFDHRIYRAVWDRFKGPIRGFVGSPYVFSPFWKFQHGAGCEDWQSRFSNAERHFEAALHDGDTVMVLSHLFDRFNMLRNQMMHGGATFGSSVNRDQLQHGTEILGCLVPEMARIMIAHPTTDWGRPFFPVVEISDE